MIILEILELLLIVQKYMGDLGYLEQFKYLCWRDKKGLKMDFLFDSQDTMGYV